MTAGARYPLSMMVDTEWQGVAALNRDAQLFPDDLEGT